MGPARQHLHERHQLGRRPPVDRVRRRKQLHGTELRRESAQLSVRRRRSARLLAQGLSLERRGKGRQERSRVWRVREQTEDRGYEDREKVAHVERAVFVLFVVRERYPSRLPKNACCTTASSRAISSSVSL